LVSVLIWLLDYIIPANGTKHFGGSTYGVYGTTIGLLIGILSPIPFGILIGAFLGGFIGELLYDKLNTARGLKASIGPIISLVTSTTLKFIVAMVYAILFFTTFWEYHQQFF
jgi:uncharacterized protein YqgC (DUF456 family)